MYGTVDSFATYRYENFYQFLKSSIRLPRYILSQLWNKINDKMLVDAPSPSLFDEKNITSAAPDNCVCLQNNQLMLISGIHGDIYTGRIYEVSTHAFSYPVGSTIRGIFEVDNLATETIQVNKNTVAFKCVRLPYFEGDVASSTKFIVLPMLHYISE